MDLLAYALPPLCAASMTGAGALACAHACGKIGKAATNALDRTPAAHTELFRLLFLSVFLIETSTIFAVVFSLWILYTNYVFQASAWALLGVAAALIPASVAATLCSIKPIEAALHAVARQPFFSEQIVRLLVITLLFIQTPFILSFLIALLINLRTSGLTTDSITAALPLIFAGLCSGFGSIGASKGLSVFAESACRAVGENRHSFTALFGFSLFSQPIIETPVIFTFLMALIITSLATVHVLDSVQLALIGSAALCVALSSYGPAFNSGRVAARACQAIKLHPERFEQISRMSLVSQVLIDTGAIYGLIIGLFLYLSS